MSLRGCRKGLVGNKHEITFWRNINVAYLDKNLSYIGRCTYQNSGNVHKHFIVSKLHQIKKKTLNKDNSSEVSTEVLREIEFMSVIYVEIYQKIKWTDAWIKQ